MAKTTKTQTPTGDFTTMDAAWDDLEHAALAFAVISQSTAGKTVKDRAVRHVKAAARRVAAIIGWTWEDLFRLVNADVADIIANSNAMVVDHKTFQVSPCPVGAEAAREELAVIVAKARTTAPDFGTQEIVCNGYQGEVVRQALPVATCGEHAVTVKMSQFGPNRGRWSTQCAAHGIITRDNSAPSCGMWSDTYRDAAQLGADHAPAAEAEAPAPACSARILVQQVRQGRDKGKWWASCTRHGIISRQGSDSFCATAAEAEQVGAEHGRIGRPAGARGRTEVPAFPVADLAELTYRAYREFDTAA